MNDLEYPYCDDEAPEACPVVLHSWTERKQSIHAMKILTRKMAIKHYDPTNV